MKVKISEYISPSTVIFIIFSLIILLSKIIFNVRPVEDYFIFLEQNQYLWVLPLVILIPLTLLLFDRIHYKKINQEKIKLFQTTIHTIQDILQNSSSRLQIAILDMEEQNVSNTLQEEMLACLNENVKLIQKLSSFNLNELVKTSDKHLSTFLLNYKEK